MSENVHVPSSFHRFWARLIDGAVVATFLMPALRSTIGADLGAEAGAVELSWWLVLYVAAAPVAYETIALWIFGTTVGKWVFSLRVVAAGRPSVPPTGPSSLLRSLTGQLDLIFGHAVQALALFRNDRTHLADWVAGTRVVAARARGTAARPRILAGAIAVFVLGSAGWAVAGFFVKTLSWNANGLTAGAGWFLFFLGHF